MRALLAAVLLLLPAFAQAIPRFAARNGMECIQCHVNPSGGGVRNDYGADVFEQVFLPASGETEVEDWINADYPAAEDEAKSAFNLRAALPDWLRIGADVRVSYLRLRPDDGPTPGSDPEITDSFFLMQADLYHAVELNPYTTLVLDVGVYTGFEAYGLFRPFPDARDLNLLLKVGRFVPAFGIREVEHQLYTREGVGFGTSDRDTGLEAIGYLGPFTLQAGLFNGTLGDTTFDTTGQDRRTFEKAVSLRASGRLIAGSFRGQLGGSFYYSANASQPNPLFTGLLSSDSDAAVAQGLNDYRYGPFLTLSLGRLTYLGDLVGVKDTFNDESVPDLDGYASYQELSYVVIQGLELVATFEFEDPDFDISGNSTTRVAGVIEWFPWPYVEFRPMVRKSWTDVVPTGGSLDLVLFAHFFF